MDLDIHSNQHCSFSLHERPIDLSLETKSRLRVSDVMSVYDSERKVVNQSLLYHYSFAYSLVLNKTHCFKKTVEDLLFEH